jgi:hypothetical protein
MRALLIFLAFVAAAAAQSSFDFNELVDKKDLHNADIIRLWRTLGISGKIRKTTANGSRDTSATFNCADCVAQLLNLSWPLVEDRGEDVVVRIATPPEAEMRRLLVFHHEEGRAWRLVDYLDSTEWDFDEPDVSVVLSGGKRWLVVKAWPRCGTGCGLVRTDWYELKNGKLRMVLTVPLSGYQGNTTLVRQFETRFVRARQSEGTEILEFVYHVEFAAGASTIDADLWGEEKVIKFSRSTGQGEFKFDAKNSEASEAFIEKIFSWNGIEPSLLFELIQDRLLMIARGPHNQRREWLKELLNDNADLPELDDIRAAFGKVR